MSNKEQDARSLWQFLRAGSRRGPALWETAGEGEGLLRERMQALAAQGFLVFFDRHIKGIPRDVVDAIVVGPTGVYVLDAKHWWGSITVQNGVLYQERKVRRDRTTEVNNVLEAAKEIGQVTLTYVQPLLVLTSDAQASHSDFVGRVRLINLDSANDFVRSQIHTLSDDVVLRAARMVDEHFPRRTTSDHQTGQGHLRDSGDILPSVEASAAMQPGQASSHEHSSHDGLPRYPGSSLAPSAGDEPLFGERSSSGGDDTFVMPQTTGTPLFREVTESPGQSSHPQDGHSTGYLPVHPSSGQPPAAAQASSLADVLRGAGHVMRQQAAGVRLPGRRASSNVQQDPSLAADQEPSVGKNRLIFGGVRLPIPSWRGVGLVSLLVILSVLVGVLWVANSVIDGMQRCSMLTSAQASQVVGAQVETTRRFWGGGCALNSKDLDTILLFRDYGAQSRAQGSARVDASQQECGLLVVAARGVRLSTREPVEQQQVPAAACVPVGEGDTRHNAAEAYDLAGELITAVRRAKVASSSGVDY